MTLAIKIIQKINSVHTLTVIFGLVCLRTVDFTDICEIKIVFM